MTSPPPRAWATFDITTTERGPTAALTSSSTAVGQGAPLDSSSSRRVSGARSLQAVAPSCASTAS
ncbi:hypothetical protein [Nocardioides sp. LHG3406-4]|uniref:hypothetical protein n=1 Tax=Nocardioides sp. LHG3406-4 TaxID=2804575 RepID=UPI003CE85ACE